MAEKWDKYYLEAEANGTCPPWESNQPFSELVRFIESGNQSIITHGSKVIELGCGCSASAVYLASESVGADCTAVDISALAIQRARANLTGSDKVTWLQADLLSDDMCSCLAYNTFDFVFDMQCFHILRNMDEATLSKRVYDLLKPGGHAMIVTGAASTDEEPLVPGPPTLSREEVLDPFIRCGLRVVSISLSRFNMTPHYATRGSPPLAWVAMFKK